MLNRTKQDRHDADDASPGISVEVREIIDILQQVDSPAKPFKSTCNHSTDDRFMDILQRLYQEFPNSLADDEAGTLRIALMDHKN